MSAECKHCGLSDDLYLGGGMLNFDRFCNFPFACHDCYSLICINLFEPDCICPNCKSNDVTRYDHPFLLPREISNNANNDNRPGDTQWHSLKKQCHSLKELAVFYQVALTTSRLFSLLAVCHFPYGFFERRS